MLNLPINQPAIKVMAVVEKKSIFFLKTTGLLKAQ